MICGKKWGGDGRQLNSVKLIVLRDHYRSLRIAFCLICQESKHLSLGLPLRIFSRFVFMRGLNTRNSKLYDSYIEQFDDATVSSLLLRKAENVSSVLLDDFGHFLGRFLWNFAEQFFTSGNVKATDYSILYFRSCQLF